MPERSLRVAVFTGVADRGPTPGLPPPPVPAAASRITSRLTPWLGLLPVIGRPSLPLRAAAAVAVSPARRGRALLPPAGRSSAVPRPAAVGRLAAGESPVIVGVHRAGRLQPEDGGRRRGNRQKVKRRRVRVVVDVGRTASVERVPGGGDGRLHVRRVLRERRPVAASRRQPAEPRRRRRRRRGARGRGTAAQPAPARAPAGQRRGGGEAAVHVRRVRQTLRDVVQLVATQADAPQPRQSAGPTLPVLRQGRQPDYIFLYRRLVSLPLFVYFLFVYFAQNKRTVKFQCTKQTGTARLNALIAYL